MVTTFVIADTHFGQESILTFKRNDCTPLRDFASIEEHDEHLVKCWNDAVRPQDKVYHLGDIVMTRRNLPILERLNGHKRLVMGNHDEHGKKEYYKYFEEIYGCRVMEGLILTHMPIHADCVDRFKLNVHGHLHANSVTIDGALDGRYLCVSAEQIDYTPISLECIRTIECIKTIIKEGN